MFFPISKTRTANPYEGLTEKQRHAFDSRFDDGDSWGRIAFRLGITRPSALGLARRGLRRMNANGWDFISRTGLTANAVLLAPDVTPLAAVSAAGMLG